jgi:hypothetical protein
MLHFTIKKEYILTEDDIWDMCDSYDDKFLTYDKDHAKQLINYVKSVYNKHFDKDAINLAECYGGGAVKNNFNVFWVDDEKEDTNHLLELKDTHELH